MPSRRLDEIRDLLTDIAHEASVLVKEGPSTADGPAVQKKGEIDLVTAYDVAAERLITDRLQSAFPSVAIVGEETASGTESTAQHEQLFIVDPIDGTTNYAAGHPFYGISMAYAERDAGWLAPKAGVVAAPGLNRIYAAARGFGATCNGTPIRVSTTASLGDALAATGFPYDRWHSDDDNTTEFVAFLKRVRGIRRCGAASVDLCLVADGTYDFYWERKLKSWDLAAGAAIVLEAGGRLTDELGGLLNLEEGALVASNAGLHDAIIEVLRPMREARANGAA